MLYEVITEFKEQTAKLIQDTLELYKAAGASPRVGQIWDCKSIGDFLCGFFVGEMVGSALSAFQIVHKSRITSYNVCYTKLLRYG